MTDCFINDIGYTRCHNNAWLTWGRWVMLGGIILVVSGVYLTTAFVSARRRDRAGVKPFMGTQWTLAVNPPKYRSTESLPAYSAGGRKTESGIGGLDAVQTPQIMHTHGERV